MWNWIDDKTSIKHFKVIERYKSVDNAQLLCAMISVIVEVDGQIKSSACCVVVAVHFNLCYWNSTEVIHTLLDKFVDFIFTIPYTYISDARWHRRPMFPFWADKQAIFRLLLVGSTDLMSRKVFLSRARASLPFTYMFSSRSLSLATVEKVSNITF